MKFRTRYTPAEKFITCSGSGIKDELQLRIVDDEERLVVIGKTDLYEYIQSHLDSVDIHKILERCAMLDDYSLLIQRPTTFMDTIGMPKTLAEAFAMSQDAKAYFDSMPTDIKVQYDNNWLKFVQDIGSEKFNNTVSKFLDSIKEKNSSEEVTEE